MNVPSHKHWMESVNGNAIDYLNPQESSIHITEISWALAAVPRFVGHTLTNDPHNVAEHSCWVAMYLYKKTSNHWIALHGLLHDAHEAYTGDIPAPMKNLPELRQGLVDVSNRLQDCILRALKIPATVPEIDELIKEADMQSLALEVKYMKYSQGNNWSGLPMINELSESLPPLMESNRVKGHRKFMSMYKTLYGDGFRYN